MPALSKKTGYDYGFKKACSAGIQLAICTDDAQCNNPGKHDGRCTEYPFPLVQGPITRGNDDYHSPEDIGVKTHDRNLMWLDWPGAGVTKEESGRLDYQYEGDFLSTVDGDTTYASCHFRVVIKWDSHNQKYYDSGITLIDDEETTKNCVPNF